MWVFKRSLECDEDEMPQRLEHVVRTSTGPEDELPAACIVDDVLIDWRKANHIHAWFVENVQDGKDDCEQYPVTISQLRQLLATCEKVIKASKLVKGLVYTGTVYDKDHPNGLVEREPGKVIKDPTVAKQLLPTRAGFFFGCTEYDEDYLEEVVRTRDWLIETLDPSGDRMLGDLYYASSW